MAALAAAIARAPRCRDFRVERSVKNLHRFSREVGPREVLAITHPRTSTEFFVAWTTEGPGRLSILRGPGRQLALEHAARTQDNWTEAYRQYHDEYMNARAYAFGLRGTLAEDMEAPFYGVWAAEEASLHSTGHDDFGEVRSDKRHGLTWGIYASTAIDQVVSALAGTIDQLDASVDVGPLDALTAEQRDLQRWPAVVAGARGADIWVHVKPEANQVRDSLDTKRLYTMFPRDQHGRLKARQRVILQPVSIGSDRDRRPWIVAVGPARVGGTEVTVGVEPLIAANQLERFDLAPWCWQKTSGDLSAAKTWGLTREGANGIDLLLRGSVKDGLEAAGLRLDEAVTRLARGSVLGLLCRDPMWPKLTREGLSRVAPLLLLGPGFGYANALLTRNSDGLRLFTLPGQRAARKASIVLVPGRKPSLEIRWTGTNARLPVVLWQRPTIPGVWTQAQAT
jgi:hypothetical protein